MVAAATRSVSTSNAQVSRVTGRKRTVTSWPIAQLIYTAAAAGAAGNAIDSGHLAVLPKSLRDLIAAKMMKLDTEGRVQAFVKPTGVPADASEALLSLGATVERTDENAHYSGMDTPLCARQAGVDHECRECASAGLWFRAGRVRQHRR